MNTLSPAEYGLVLLTLGAVTFATRATPFLLFGNRSTPSVVLYLGRMLPPAIMAMLVVYCLKDVNFFSGAWTAGAYRVRTGRGAAYMAAQCADKHIRRNAGVHAAGAVRVCVIVARMLARRWIA